MKKKKEAILESKCILEQTESSMVNYGGAYSNFALAEKSGSFLAGAAGNHARRL